MIYCEKIVMGMTMNDKTDEEKEKEMRMYIWISGQSSRCYVWINLSWFGWLWWKKEKQKVKGKWDVFGWIRMYEYLLVDLYPFLALAYPRYNQKSPINPNWQRFYISEEKIEAETYENLNFYVWGWHRRID